MAAVAHNYSQDDVHPLLRHPRPIKRDPAKAHRMLDMIAGSEEALSGLHREKSLTTRWLERPMYEQQMALEVEEQQKAWEVAKQQKEFKVEERLSQLNEDPEPEIVQVKQPSKQEPGIQVLKIPQGTSDDDSDSDLLDKWTNPNRPTSSINLEPTPAIDAPFAPRRPPPLGRPVSYNSQHLLSPQWTASPTALTPESPIPRPVPSVLDSLQELRRNSVSSDGSCECEHQHPAVRNYQPTQQAKDVQAGRPVSYHPQSFTSLDSPPLQQRARPTSFANYHQRARSGTKIASSRGLRNNSCPTTSPRPVSSSIPRSVAGEDIENDVACQYSRDNEVGPPTSVTFETPAYHSPSTLSAVQAAPTTPVRSPFDGLDNVGEKTKAEKKSKSRWSSIPQAFKNFGARRRASSTAGTQERPKFAAVVDDVRQMKLTEENLHRYEIEAYPASMPPKRQSAIEFIPTPAYSPMNTNISPTSPHLVAPLPAPFAPWATDAPPSPAATTADRHRRSSSSGATSLSLKQASLRLSVEIPQQMRPSSMHSYSSRPAPTTAATTPPTDIPRFMTPASRRNTPAQERTCILCKAVRPTTEFVARRITQNCWHEPATCVECLQTWILTCARGVRGLEGCTCPECGEAMAKDDVVAFTGVSPL